MLFIRHAGNLTTEELMVYIDIFAESQAALPSLDNIPRRFYFKSELTRLK